MKNRENRLQRRNQPEADIRRNRWNLTENDSSSIDLPLATGLADTTAMMSCHFSGSPLSTPSKAGLPAFRPMSAARKRRGAKGFFLQVFRSIPPLFLGVSNARLLLSDTAAQPLDCMHFAGLSWATLLREYRRVLFTNEIAGVESNGEN